MTPSRTKPLASLPSNYLTVLRTIKARIRAAQNRAATAVNRELVTLYLDIGRQLAAAEWGDRAVERLARDLHAELPAVRGFSRSNLFHMRQVFLAWREAPAKVQQLVGQIPWGHHIALVSRVTDGPARIWYLERIARHGWSRAMLTIHIDARLHEREGQAVTNFPRTLPAPQAELAREMLKDPYNFDFLTLGPEIHERDLEEQLTHHVEKFLLELGVGFSFVGRQVPLEVGDEDFFIDLLFYHLKLRCFVVVELKARAFKPSDAGQLNFYLSAVDDKLRHPDDKPSVGLLLCRSKNRVVAEYALRDMTKPIGVADWQRQLVHALPEGLKGRLPTIEEIETELATVRVTADPPAATRPRTRRPPKAAKPKTRRSPPGTTRPRSRK